MRIVPTEPLPNVTVFGAAHGSVSDLIFEALAKAIRGNVLGEADDASVTVTATPPAMSGELINFQITLSGKRSTGGPIDPDAWKGDRAEPTYSPTAEATPSAYPRSDFVAVARKPQSQFIRASGRLGRYALTRGTFVQVGVIVDL